MTKCNTGQLGFSFLRKRKLTVDFGGGEITSDSGLLLVRQADGYLVKEGNKRILKLCMAMCRRQWFEGLWGKSKDFDLPVSFTSHL